MNRLGFILGSFFFISVIATPSRCEEKDFSGAEAESRGRALMNELCKSVPLGGALTADDIYAKVIASISLVGPLQIPADKKGMRMKWEAVYSGFSKMPEGIGITPCAPSKNIEFLQVLDQAIPLAEELDRSAAIKIRNIRDLIYNNLVYISRNAEMAAGLAVMREMRAEENKKMK